MTLLRRLRLAAGAAVYDWPDFRRRIRARSATAGQPEPWLAIRNRNDRLTAGPDGRGYRCEWRFGSDLHIASVFPSAGKRLMQTALGRWPIESAESPRAAGAPVATFVIGHRGMSRLPHLLATLRSIAAQRAPVACIVVEQSVIPETRDALPKWVQYIHTPPPSSEMPYCRSWAFNVGVAAAQTDVLILHDNDILVPERYAEEAAARIADGWEFLDLKRFVFYLGAYDTGRVFAVGRATPARATVTQNVHGGTIVASRAAYDAIGGFDESFIGWGGEDNDFWDRANVGGRVYDYGYLPVVHLHHDDQPGKRARQTAAIDLYAALETVPPRERIARLRLRQQGRIEGPSIA